MIETYRGIVRPNHLDHMGHMNVQWYVAKFDDATWHLFSKLGLTSSYFETETCGMAALEQNIKYLAEVMAGDLLLCRSKATAVENKILKFTHYMYNAETETKVATVDMVAVHLDRKIRKSSPLPEFVSQKFAEFGW